jgi:hypothetical protein
MKRNCWEENQCGREPGGQQVGKLGPCPVPLFALADGFLGGENAGRACTFVVNRLSEEERKTACSQSLDTCEKCKFHNKLKKKYKKSFTEPVFNRFIQHAYAR